MSGFPRVEAVPGAPDERQVTYGWRAREGVRSVELIGSPAADASPMERVAGTDLWTATFRVRADLRHRYAFFESEDGARFDYGTHRHLLRPDPDNPARFPDDTFDASVPALPESEWLPASVLTLPDALPQPWIRFAPGVPRGTVAEHRFESALLGNSRRVWTYTPASEARGLLVMNDGWEWRALTPVAPILDNLIAAGRIPPLVAVLHECPAGEREAELGCGEKFASAVADELMPWIAGRFGAVDAGRTIVAGQSYGGLSAAFLALRHPALFGNVLSQSGAYWFDDDALIHAYAASPTLPVRFALDIGLLEGDMVATNRRFRDTLTTKGYDVTYREAHGDHSWLSWRGTLPDGLTALTATW